MNYINKYTCLTCDLFSDGCTDWRWRDHSYEDDHLIPEHKKNCHRLRNLYECLVFEKFCHFIGAPVDELRAL